jgi:hypothetical protein
MNIVGKIRMKASSVLLSGTSFATLSASTTSS